MSNRGVPPSEAPPLQVGRCVTNGTCCTTFEESCAVREESRRGVLVGALVSTQIRTGVLPDVCESRSRWCAPPRDGRFLFVSLLRKSHHCAVEDDGAHYSTCTPRMSDADVWYFEVGTHTEHMYQTNRHSPCPPTPLLRWTASIASI